MHKNERIRALNLSVCGSLHKSKNIPCQDYALYKSKGTNFVAAVSDGAGSAKYGKIGAKIIVETICDSLLNINMQNAAQEVEKAVIRARDKALYHRLNKTQSEYSLADFSATMVGVFYDGKKGLFFHIGDGAAIAVCGENKQDIVVSEPENGAFPCETFFFTMPDWKLNLRFTEFSDAEKIVLMTDGVTGFVFDDFGQIRENFLFPIMQYLNDESRKTYALKALENTLGSAKAMHINSDDKTILWAKLK
ncbi:MAG: protein phosphatase 2C domain-containing protein [Alphaproteobacteria bacterium]|nr:protein phosphatase 2C domain-containing protein [Alphaproteobacteria bacterium]